MSPPIADKVRALIKNKRTSMGGAVPMDVGNVGQQEKRDENESGEYDVDGVGGFTGQCRACHGWSLARQM